MPISVRLLSIVALLVTALTGLGQVRPAWARELNLDWWELPVLWDDIRQGERELAALDPACEIAAARARDKVRVTEALLAGQLTLPQAAARFRHLNANVPPPARVELRNHFEGATEEERLCRQVIHWAVLAVQGFSPSESARIRGRLEAELIALLAKPGGPGLPD